MLIKGKTVLVIEDNDEHMKIVVGYLKSLRAKILKCSTGEKALDTFKKRKIDLVIIDYRLPYKNGIILTNEIKTIKDIPIILISGQDDIIQDVDYIKKFQFDDVIAKPYHKQRLIESIEKL